MAYWVVLATLVTSCLLTLIEGQNVGDRCKNPTEKKPYPGDCDYYLFCDRKFLWVKGNCPASKEFSPSQLKCVSRKLSNCQKKCDKLPLDSNGAWDSSSCTSGPSNLGATCSLTCNANFELRGSAVVKCTEFGWNSTNSNLIPKCVDLQCYSAIIQDALNTTLTRCNGMLFVMDESGSIGAPDFLKSKIFVKDVANSFPLSPSRTGGIITFDSITRDRIPLSETNTNSFKTGVDNINYNGGGTRVLEALQRAHVVINNQYKSGCYVVILITDGNSETEATPAANAIKQANHPLFSIAVGSPNSLSYVESLSSMDQNGVKHFFYSRNFDILVEIGKYLNAPLPPKQQKTKCGP